MSIHKKIPLRVKRQDAIGESSWNILNIQGIPTNQLQKRQSDRKMFLLTCGGKKGYPTTILLTKIQNSNILLSK